MKKSVMDVLSEALGITEGSTQLATKKTKDKPSNATVPFRKLGNTVIGYRETNFETIKLTEEGPGVVKLTYNSKETKEKQSADFTDQDTLLDKLDMVSPQDNQLWC